MSKSSGNKPKTVLGAIGTLLLALLIYFLQGGKGTAPAGRDAAAAAPPPAVEAREAVSPPVAAPESIASKAVEASGPVPEAKSAAVPAEESKPQRAAVRRARWHKTNLQRHWEKHQAEFPEYHSAEEYGSAVEDFVDHPPAGALHKTTADGDQMYYHPPSNRFAVVTADGVIKTCFKPDQGIRYWNRQ
ncbi:MAG: hypothetical protein J6Y80_05020 [Victivallales bacterium]|nr:hypothetical protein [Victivallales bacterium]